MRIQPSIPSEVRVRFRVLCTVKFDNQQPLAAEKIYDVRTERDLSDKLVAVQAPAAQLTPKAILRLGVVTSESPCPRR